MREVSKLTSEEEEELMRLARRYVVAEIRDKVNDETSYEHKLETRALDLKDWVESMIDGAIDLYEEERPNA